MLEKNFTSYRPNNFHAFWVIFTLREITQLGISSQMSRKYTILPHNNSRNLISSNTWLHINANLWVKNVKLIVNCHLGKVTSCNIAPSKTHNLSRWVLGEVLHLYYFQENE